MYLANITQSGKQGTSDCILWNLLKSSINTFKGRIIGATLYQKLHAFETPKPETNHNFLENIKNQFPTVQSGLSMYLYESEDIWNCILADMT